MNTFGDRLKFLRGSMTQASLAALLGIRQTTLSNYERCRNEPNYATVLSICSHFGVCPEWFVFGSGPMHPARQLRTPPSATGYIIAQSDYEADYESDYGALYAPAQALAPLSARSPALDLLTHETDSTDGADCDGDTAHSARHVQASYPGHVEQLQRASRTDHYESRNAQQPLGAVSVVSTTNAHYPPLRTAHPLTHSGSADGGVDVEDLFVVAETLEEVLLEYGYQLTPTRKAEVLCHVCRQIREGQRLPRPAQLLRLIRECLAALD